MKGNKKILAVAFLVLLLAVCFGTYAIYKSSATGSGSVSTAAWVVNVNNTDITATNTFTLGSINWGSSTYGKNGKIAPGDQGTVNIVIDADGSEVDVAYTIAIDSSAITNPNISITASSGSLTGTIPYSATAGEMERTVTLQVTWTGVDNASANTADITTAGTSLSIPVTVTAVQNPNPAA